MSIYSLTIIPLLISLSLNAVEVSAGSAASFPISYERARLITDAQPAPRAQPNLGQPIETSSGEVSITLSQPTFREGDTIAAAVANGLAQVIYSDMGKTDCSIVFLEQWTGSAWKRLSGCALGIPASALPIGPGRGRQVTINPKSMHLAKLARDHAFAFGEGWYRLKFTYRLSLVPPEETLVVYSPEFQVVR